MEKKFRLKDKFNFSKARILKICAYTLCLIASIALLAGLNFQPFAAAVNNRKIPIYCVDRSDNKVAITFDAACFGSSVLGAESELYSSCPSINASEH